MSSIRAICSFEEKLLGIFNFGKHMKTRLGRLRVHVACHFSYKCIKF